MELYTDLIASIPEFETYDIMGEEHYVECGVSPLGTLGHWLNELAKNSAANDGLF